MSNTKNLKLKRKVVLSERDLETLKFYGQGFRGKALADKCNISIDALESRYKTINSKFGASEIKESYLAAKRRRMLD